MKTVSQGYKAAQASNLIYPVRKVELFRRLTNGSGWEAAAIDVTTEIVRLDRLSWKLDTDALNEYKASNISIEVDNSKRLWDDGSVGRFAGFLRFHSQIRISLGLKVAGADEISPVFTGVIEDAVEDSGMPTLQLDIQSMDQLLEDADADKAAIPVNNELLGIGDGLRAEFELANTPVGAVKEVRVAGEVMRPGTRWTASNLNDPQKKAVIKFETVQPQLAAEVRSDCVVWKRDQQIHNVVNDLLASVPQVQTAAVETVQFDPAAQREILHTCVGDFAPYSLYRALIIPEDEPPAGDGQLTIDAYDTAAKWLAGLNVSRINFDRIKNGIHPRWTSQYEADYEPAQEKSIIEGNYAFPWFEFLPSGTTATLSGSVRTVTHAGGADYVLQNTAEEFNLSRCVCARLRFSSISGTVTLGTMVGQSPFLGAQIEFLNLNQVRVRSAITSANYSVSLTQFHTFRLALTLTSVSAGTWALFVDGTQVLSGTLGAFPSGTSGIRLQSSGSNTFYIDYLRYNGISATPSTGQLTLKVDYGPQLAGLTTFSLITTLGPFFAELQGLASGAQFYHSWSADDLTYSAETAVSNGGNIGSWTNAQSPRYVKFRIAITDTLESLPYGIKRIWLPAIAESPLIDGGSGTVSWDAWKAAIENNNGSVQRFTAAGANSQSGFSFHRALGANDTIISDEFAVSQGFPMPAKMAFITLMNTSGVNLPVHRLSVITLTTRNVLISMANFASRSVLDVIKELARIADFELGMDGMGRFFFRNKAAAAVSLLTLDGSNIEKVQSINPGWDRVFNSIRASFGEFVKTVDSQTEGEAAPTSNQRFGVRPLSVGGGGMLFQTDVDLATVMAKRYFNRYKEPKRRATLTARFMPELELGDRVTFTIPAPRQIGQIFDARIIGVAQDLMNFRTELDLLEVA
ncbi:MAG: hypothetical protein A2270_10480 [Elusimicrobia bacterium RIFOXYA12_FULL_51_18]|nr:MAG: hypothetical protein A2270_10480 [Elusimicrobia bacterium RIFOXYA12_FULL_51_18]OGS29510.1 MAG: hypothetical protein A2218_00710 [Elusimicrobia bacterium RIFOXYA2_FULL_53_38]